jgi:hypothetical protein
MTPEGLCGYYMPKATQLREERTNWRRKAANLRKLLKSANGSRYILAEMVTQREEEAAAGWAKAEEMCELAHANQQMHEQNLVELGNARIETREEREKCGIWKTVAGLAQEENRRLLGAAEQYQNGVRELSGTMAERSSVISEELAALQRRWQRCEDQRFAACEQVEVLERECDELKLYSDALHAKNADLKTELKDTYERNAKNCEDLIAVTFERNGARKEREKYSEQLAEIAHLVNELSKTAESGGHGVREKLRVLNDKVTFWKDWSGGCISREQEIERCFRRGMRIMQNRIDRTEADLTLSEITVESYENALIMEKLDNAMTKASERISNNQAENKPIEQADPCGMCSGDCGADDESTPEPLSWKDEDEIEAEKTVQMSVKDLEVDALETAIQSEDFEQMRTRNLELVEQNNSLQMEVDDWKGHHGAAFDRSEKLRLSLIELRKECNELRGDLVIATRENELLRNTVNASVLGMGAEQGLGVGGEAEMVEMLSALRASRQSYRQLARVDAERAREVEALRATMGDLETANEQWSSKCGQLATVVLDLRKQLANRQEARSSGRIELGGSTLRGQGYTGPRNVRKTPEASGVSAENERGTKGRTSPSADEIRSRDSVTEESQNDACQNSANRFTSQNTERTPGGEVDSWLVRLVTEMLKAMTRRES